MSKNNKERYCTSSHTAFSSKLQVWGRREMHTRFWWGDLREGDHLEDPGVDGRIILKWFFKTWDGGTWTGLIWLRIGTGGGLL
jgi:hypothetical protein